MSPSRMAGSRRTGAALASLVGVALVVGACAPGGAGSPSTPSADAGSPAGASDRVVKVGFLSPVTGTVAAAGTEMREGWELYWEEHGSTVGDVTVETIFEDDAGNPDTALTKAKRLVEDEKVELLVGPLLANTGLAVADYAVQQGIPNLHPVSAADDLTQRLADPLVIRVGAYSGSQMNYAGGQWAYDEGHRTAITFCPDYAFGWESCGGFVRAFVEAGGTITEQLWYPLGTQDFSTYVSQVGNSSADIAFIATAGGADGPNFLKTFSEFGFKESKPLLANCCAVDQATLRAIGDLALDITSVSYWAEGRESPEVEKFVSLYEDKHGKIPSLNVAGAYLTAGVFAEALKSTGGVVDGAAFVTAMRGISLEDSLYGPMSFDDHNNPTGPMYIRHVEKRADGVLWNVVDKTYEDVSQFWTYDPAEFLENPAYSRSFTGQ